MSFHDLFLSAEELKKKWKNLKDTFAKHLKSNRHIGDEKNAKSYKNWKWAKLMEQFKPYFSFTKNDTKIEYLEDNSQLVLIDSDSNSSLEIETKSETIQLPEFVEASSSQIPVETIIHSFKQDRSLSPIDDVNFLHKRHKSDLSPTEMIFLGYARTIETFSPKLQAITKLKIAQVIMEQEMLHFQETDINHL